MAEEGVLKIECAKVQNNIHLMEDDLSQLEAAVVRTAATASSGRNRLIAQEQAKFENQRKAVKTRIKELCDERHKGAEKLIDSYPGMEKREVAGRCEIESVEEHLAEVYPKSLLDNYVCTSPIAFDSDSEAYSAYVYAERKVVRMARGTFAANVFNGITSLLTTICDGKMGGKAALLATAVASLSFIFAPFLFLTLFTIVGCCAIVQGVAAEKVLRNLYSVKRYITEAYDEDVFNKDKTDVLDLVDNFLSGVMDAYFQEVDEQEFTMNPKVLEDYDAKVKREDEKLKAAIEAKKIALEQERKRAADLLAELDRVTAERETQAKEARSKFLESLDWKMEWFGSMLLDVTNDKRVIGCNWTKGNTLYYSRDLEQLQNFEVLVSYQSFLHMHPSYLKQIAIDYKYMGGLMVPFSRLQANIFEMCTDSEKIEKKMEQISNDLKSRVSNILQSCPNIEEFNALMATYEAPGETYVVVHLMGLATLTTELKALLKNGPKVGYFFKLYFTSEELSALVKDIPFDDIAEYGEVGKVVTPRTAAQLRRVFESDT